MIIRWNLFLTTIQSKMIRNLKDFREDLKAVFKIASVQRRKVVFFIADKDIYEVNNFNFILIRYIAENNLEAK